MKTKPVPDYGDMFTIKEFISLCECGALIDYDGSGYYAESQKTMTDVVCSPSDVMNGKIDNRFGYVMWFNK